jgi:hypothetical protein
MFNAITPSSRVDVASASAPPLAPEAMRKVSVNVTFAEHLAPTVVSMAIGPRVSRRRASPAISDVKMPDGRAEDLRG